MNRTTPEYKLWRAQIYARDNWKCKLCDSKEKIEAHHIQPVRSSPHLALEVSNGITLCFRCHRTIFGKEIRLAHVFKNLLENGVNSVEAQAGNTEPSQEGNPLKGVTTRRRDYILEQFINRQIPCSQCHKLVERHYYRAQRASNTFCDQQCKILFMKGKPAKNKKEVVSQYCEFCKKLMQPTPTDIHRKKKFCNNSCQLKWQWRIQKRKPSNILKGRWAKAYEACVICKMMAKRHYGKGKCMKCYNREYVSNSPTKTLPERDDIV